MTAGVGEAVGVAAEGGDDDLACDLAGEDVGDDVGDCPTAQATNNAIDSRTKLDGDISMETNDLLASEVS